MNGFVLLYVYPKIGHVYPVYPEQSEVINHLNQKYMATFKATIKKQRADGLYTVYIRVTHQRLPPPTVKSALLNIKRKHLFFDFKIKAKYLAFISCLLEKPDLSVKTALKSIFRKSQVRTISEKFGLNLNAQIVCLSPSQWLNCFLEMLEVVPEKFHPS